MDAPLYVIRIQQVQARQSTCILFQNDSEYHYERDTFDKIEIFEGRLDPSETPLLRNLINTETLRVLTQNKIVDSQFRAAEDEVSLALIRPEGWQTLRFPDAISRASFSRVLDPILNLLTSLGKRPHTLLDEDRSRNNCYPSGEISLKKRPTENADVAPAATHKGSVATNSEASFLLRVVSNSIDEEGVANSCVILYADGKYHWERMIQVSGRKVVTSDIFEDQVDSIALQQLPAILNDPKLWSGDHKKLPEPIVIRAANTVFLSVPHNGEVRQVSLSIIFGIFRPGIGARADVKDNGIQLLRPLQKWLKANVKEKKATRMKDAPFSNCVAPSS